MRVLWFTNTPSMAENKAGHKPVGGGWIKSLEKEIVKSKKIELGISFYSNNKLDDFNQEVTKYFPISKNIPSSKAMKLYDRMVQSMEPNEDVEKFVAIIKEFKPDLIHVLGTEGPFGLIQEKIKNIPIVISIQGNLTVYKDKYFSGFSKYDVKKHSSLKSKLVFNTYNDFYKKFKKAVIREQRILKPAKNIIGRTDWDRRITRVLSPESTYFHNDEILRDLFYQQKWQPNKSDRTILFTTTGSNLYKGLETILKAANQLDKLKINYKWHIAGVSPNDELVRLTERTFKIKASKNIVFLGKLSEEELVAQLLKATIYIMISHIENSPNNLCEAMILGLPCIASDVGGTSSLLTNKEDGLLIQDGDCWVLAGAVLELMDAKEIAIKYGENARKKALLRHNPKRIVDELLEIYNSILEN